MAVERTLTCTACRKWQHVLKPHEDDAALIKRHEGECVDVWAVRHLATLTQTQMVALERALARSFLHDDD